MKIDAVGISTTNMSVTIRFYEILGFDFTNIDTTSDHVEPITPLGSSRLMIDKVGILKDIIHEDPKPSNHSSFAIHYETAQEIDTVISKLKEANFKIVKEPWDAFWHQHYAVVEDPDGYRVDLYADIQQ